MEYIDAPKEHHLPLGGAMSAVSGRELRGVDDAQSSDSAMAQRKISPALGPSSSWLVISSSWQQQFVYE